MLLSAPSAPGLPNSKVFACAGRSEDYRISRSMEPNWTKVDFRNAGRREAARMTGLRSAHEALARDLSISLSAFLRSSVTVDLFGRHGDRFSATF